MLQLTQTDPIERHRAYSQGIDDAIAYNAFLPSDDHLQDYRDGYRDGMSINLEVSNGCHRNPYADPQNSEAEATANYLGSRSKHTTDNQL